MQYNKNKNMRKIILTRGIPGSGKTTWAKKWVEEDSEHRIRINWDDLRRMFGKYWVPSREEFIQDVTINILNDSLNYNYDIVVDNMNLSERSTSIFKSFAEVNHYTIEYKDFKTPLEECLLRNSWRKGDECIDEKVIIEIYNKNLWFYK